MQSIICSHAARGVAKGDGTENRVPAARCVQGIQRGTPHPPRAAVVARRPAAGVRIRTQSLEPARSGGQPTGLPREHRDHAPPGT